MGRHIPYNGGREKTLPMPDWEVFLVAGESNTILGLYGLRELAVEQLRKITANYPQSNIRIISRTYPFKKRPNVGDLLV
jgi:hypothetical protein